MDEGGMDLILWRHAEAEEGAWAWTTCSVP